MLAFQGLTFKETGAYYCSIFLFYDLKASMDWENAVDEEFEENKEDKYLIYFTVKIKSELTLWEFVKEHPKLMMSLPVSFPNQNLMDPELLKRTSSSSAGLYHRPMCRDLPPRHIHSHHGHERLHSPAHRPRRRTLRSGLDRRRARWSSSCSGRNGRFVTNGAAYPWSKAAAHLKEAKPEMKDKSIPLDKSFALPVVYIAEFG